MEAASMNTVEISKSPPVLVQPSEPVTETGDISLSSYDKHLVSRPATVLLVFEHPIQEPVATIERGLSRALVHYYPIAGRLAAGATAGEVVIKRTGELGVSFVAASANCAMEDVQDLSDPSLKEELCVFYLDGRCRYSDPLVLMQVTVFSCGGFVMGVTWNHSVADGVGMGQFLQAVGELSRGMPSPSVVPVRHGDSLVFGPPPVFSKFMRLLGSLRPSQMVLLDITIQSSLIQRIKEKCSCSVFEAVAAVLWRCRTRAIASDPAALTVLFFPTNARTYAGAKEGYYGNCLVWRLVTATAGAVADGDVLDLVKMIHAAKGRVPDQSDMDELQQLPDWYNLLRITSWRNIGFEAPDFGAGRPARVMAHSPPQRDLPKCTACIPSMDEYNVLTTCVKEDHASAFLHELADMHLNYI
uniref:Uncharacterized protein n=1 Tax=Avena sativa TaxID=4498 RepID=A0ACD5XCC8_AVESA